MKRYAILYLATFIVMLPLDLFFLGTIAKSFFTAQVGDMLQFQMQDSSSVDYIQMILSC